MKFKEINDIIDYYRSQEYIIIKHHYQFNTIIVEDSTGNISKIEYAAHWETNGEYYYKIL